MVKKFISRIQFCSLEKNYKNDTTILLLQAKEKKKVKKKKKKNKKIQ